MSTLKVKVLIAHLLLEVATPASPTLGAHAHPCPWVLGGHGCDIIGNVTIFEYMGAI